MLKSKPSFQVAMVDTGEHCVVYEVTAVEDVAEDTTVYPGEVV